MSKTNPYSGRQRPLAMVHTGTLAKDAIERGLRPMNREEKRQLEKLLKKEGVK
jgi:hypothetical protein